MSNYCRHGIHDYASMDSVLRSATLLSAPSSVQWIECMHKAFCDLKQALTSAPALGLPDYHQPFHLHVHEKDGYASGILVQKHGSHYRHVTCSSSRLPPVALGMVGCLRSVSDIGTMIDKSSPIVLGQYCVIHVPHAVLQILNTSTTQQKEIWL
uniref:Reverse transcriptase/retrotransposon-derived protein RNase H-like domain-containing protein n=1 Tax=Scophthalmus maximus TaxID=52904 RepID=A0A8D3DZV7_SCOMX